MLGAVLAWFASTQAVTITGLGPLVAAGPVLAGLAGAGAGAADKPTERAPAAVADRGEAPVQQTTECVTHETGK